MKGLIKNGHIVRFDENKTEVINGFITTNDNNIETCQAGNPNISESEFDYVIDADGRVVTPGLVNAHHHFYSTFATGISGVQPSENFIEILENLWWRLDKSLLGKDIYYSAIIPLMLSIRSGFTTIFDHHASPNSIEGSLDHIKQAMEHVGARGVLCYEVSDRDGKETANQGIRENIRFINENKNNPMIKGLFGLHAAFTISYDTFNKIAEEFGALDTGIHVHTAEDMADQIITYRSTGRRVIEWLNDFGLLNNKSLCVHGLYLNRTEIDIIKEKQAFLVHAPQSNLNNGVGFLDIPKTEKNGIIVGLGSDGMTSNLLNELRTSIFATHYLHKSPNASFMEQVNMLIKNNYTIAKQFFGSSFGNFKAGAPADIVVFDYRPYTPLNSDNFAGHLVYGMSQTMAQDVIVNGKPVLKNKEFINLDEKQLFAKAAQIAQQVWKRF